MSPPRETPFVPALGFSWLTPLYDAVVAIAVREDRLRRELLSQVDLAPGRFVLDVGCGTGTQAILMRLRERGCDVTGIDADPAILAIARRKARAAGVSVQFDEGDATRLPYGDAWFDCVTASLFFHHLSSLQKREAAAQMLRVLRPGGALHVADWGPPSNAWLGSAFALVRLIDGFENTRDNVEGRLGSIFAEAGFVEVTQTGSLSTALGTIAMHRASKPDVISGAS